MAEQYEKTASDMKTLVGGRLTEVLLDGGYIMMTYEFDDGSTKVVVHEDPYTFWLKND